MRRNAPVIVDTIVLRNHWLGSRRLEVIYCVFISTLVICIDSIERPLTLMSKSAWSRVMAVVDPGFCSVWPHCRKFDPPGGGTTFKSCHPRLFRVFCWKVHVAEKILERFLGSHCLSQWRKQWFPLNSKLYFLLRYLSNYAVLLNSLDRKFSLGPGFDRIARRWLPLVRESRRDVLWSSSDQPVQITLLCAHISLHPRLCQYMYIYTFNADFLRNNVIRFTNYLRGNPLTPRCCKSQAQWNGCLMRPRRSRSYFITSHLDKKTLE